ncbi:MAG: hypothetical protein QW478_09030, partial [Candidatus Micrarchaeaceae archaeon]
AMMMIDIAVYAFIIANEKHKKSLYLISGVFTGLAYLANPLGALLLILFVLICFISILNKKLTYKSVVQNLIFIIIGFIIAYSLIGIVYLFETGNYFLYPELTHAVYLYQEVTQPTLNYCISGNFCLIYTTGYPSFYLSTITDFKTIIHPYLKYFGISFYVFIAMAVLSILFMPKKKWALVFIGIFLFYLIAIMFFPANITFNNGIIDYYPISEAAYITTILTLPLIVVTALGLETMLKQKSLIVRAVALVLVCFILYYDISVLNNDIGFYRASMYTLHAFVNYVQAHYSSTFYGNFLFSFEANLLTSYKYKIAYLQNCSSAYLNGLPNGTYVATGGTISFSMDPSLVDNFDNCVVKNLTDYSAIYSVTNPFQNYSGDAPQLKIYLKK